MKQRRLAHASLALVILGVFLWAKDPAQFDIVSFSLPGAQQGILPFISVIPKISDVRLPVVLYFSPTKHGSFECGSTLRQFADLGFAAIVIDRQQDPAAFDEEQITALLGFLREQRWVDISRTVWVGRGIGVPRCISYALERAPSAPRLIVSLAEETNTTIRAYSCQVAIRSKGSSSGISIPSKIASSSIILVESNCMGEARSGESQELVSCLEGLGIPVRVSSLSQKFDSFGDNQRLAIRLIAEWCRNMLPESPIGLKSRSSKPSFISLEQFWPFVVPICLLGLILALLSRYHLFSRAYNVKFGLFHPQNLESMNGPNFDRYANSRCASRGDLWIRRASCCVAILATMRIITTCLLPLLPVVPWTINLMCRVRANAPEDQEIRHLSKHSSLLGQPLSCLLEHAQLSRYTRSLVHWSLLDSVYFDFVLSPTISREESSNYCWRRPLWKHLYPRVRREKSTPDAAQIVVRYLRERIEINPSLSDRHDLGLTWTGGIASPVDFDLLYVAALRSVAIPARLGSSGQVELWCDGDWKSAPRPPANLIADYP